MSTALERIRLLRSLCYTPAPTDDPKKRKSSFVIREVVHRPHSSELLLKGRPVAITTHIGAKGCYCIAYESPQSWQTEYAYRCNIAHAGAYVPEGWEVVAATKTPDEPNCMWPPVYLIATIEPEFVAIENRKRIVL